MVNEDPKKEDKKSEHKKPTYKSEGVAVWKNIDKNGNEYLSIKIVGHSTFYAYENKPK